MYKYEATDVGFNEENDALTVAFGGLPDADGHATIYLMFQRSTDEGEDESGVEGVYAEWCGQGMSCYGCISSVDLHPESIRVTFTGGAGFYAPKDVEDAWNELKLTELLVTFTLGRKKFKDLTEKLSFIFKGCDCYSVRGVDASTSA